MTSQNSRNTAEVGEQESQALVDKKSEKPDALPGPSTNPATNLLIADIVMRGVSRAVRKSLHKSVLRTGYSRDKAKEIVEDRSVVRTLALYGATRFATRSTPGALPRRWRFAGEVSLRPRRIATRSQAARQCGNRDRGKVSAVLPATP